ncbi:MAG: hypothetical protein LIO93_00215 [Bacteroidales bacterium]|nr:hypothetical protein [Bacteroidales bacterium]
MEDSKRQFNLEPLHDFFEEWVHPSDFSKILDELLIDYASLVISRQMEGSARENIHEDTTRFIFYLRTLRDILPKCEK